MAKSRFANALDLVQTQFTAVLQPLGFRKAGRTYNRPSVDELIQVINLQIWRPDPVPPSAASSQAQGSHDKFTVNLGVWIPEVAEYHLVPPRTKTIQEYDCQVRSRLGQFVEPPADLWWPLDDSRPDSAAAALGLLETKGLAWLETFSTREGIVAGWNRAPDAKIVVAIIEAKRGREQRARQLLTEQIAHTGNRSHHQYVRTVAQQLGIGPIPDADS